MQSATQAPGERELVEATLEGRIEAFGELVERHRPSVQRLAERIVGSREEGEDVTQDAFLNAFNRLDSLQNRAGFKSWLMQIAYNRALSVSDRRRRSPVALDPEGEVDAIAADPEANARKAPARELEEGERRRRMAAKIALISAANRGPLVLRDVEGYSYEEIAELTDSPAGSVKGRIHRARKQLIELLRNNTYDWELPDDR